MATTHVGSLLASSPSKILNLLSTRETWGVVPPSTRGPRGPAQVECRAHRDVRVEDLASAIAWNPRRMQNMILAVGPGTPASEVLRVTDLSSASSSPPSSDDVMVPSDLGDSDGDSDDEGRSEDVSDVDSSYVARGQRRRRWTRKVLQTVHAAQEEAEVEAEAEAAKANRSQAAEEHSDIEASETTVEEKSEDAVMSAGDVLMEELLNEKEKEELARTMEEKISAASNASASPTYAAEQSHHSCSSDFSSSSLSPANRQWSPRPSLPTSFERPIAPSMRHGGCVNTATWLTCPWRLSYANHDDQTLHGGMIVSSSHSANSAVAFGFEQEDDVNNDNDGATPGCSPSTVIAMDTTECTTQLITSGDDRVVKFWDVGNAMGSISPYPGGPSTVCPFAHSSRLYSAPSEVVSTWKKRSKRGDPVPGSVTPIVALETGHRANVFHATPLYYQPGKVATCGADGYMRLCDVEAGSNASSSTIVVSPLDEDGIDMPIGYLRMRGGMCFSHHFLDANTGLLCSEHGLRRFDLRLSPREQPSGSILGGQYSSCKSCAIWSASEGGGCFDSAYVFVGSSSGDVALCDLRMANNTSSKILQHYRPSCFGPYDSVSVSGLDISRDQKELLVSYESDQIYSFPVFPQCRSAAGPSVEELASYSAALAAPSCTEETSDNDKMSGRSRLLPELASYGGHLNRFTFLKRATFAGPNDEYICTGSDSGHAWIYEKATGAVISLLKADHSTCNGVVPHPTLPFFATYGIDSTAKLWRATHPVGDNANDSDLGRSRTAHKTDYEPSQLVHSWKSTQSKLDLFCDPDIDEEDHAFTLLPDEVPSHDDEDDSIFGGLAGVLFHSVSRFGNRQSMPFIANDLASLPKVLLQNYFTCLRAFVSGDEEPIKSSLDAFKRRVGLMRLKHQADRLGLLWDPEMPWVMKPKLHVSKLEREYLSAHDEDVSGNGPCIEVMYGSNADLVPEHPGDWIPFDSEMSSDPLHFGMDFNQKEYKDFFLERYARCRCRHHQPKENEPKHPRSNLGTSDDFVLEAVKVHRERSESISGIRKEGGSIGSDANIELLHDRPNSEARLSDCQLREDVSPADTGNEISQHNDFKAWDLLFDTVMVLKEGGNAALSIGAISLAAQRYDKAIRYCSIAYLRFPKGHLSFLSPHQDVLLENGGREVRWTPMLKGLVTIRLNLSMVLLRSEVYYPTLACDHARLALLELKPFATSKGSVLTGRKLNKPREGEPEETYTQAKELQAKSYFRLGNAQMVTGDYGAAVKSFDLSIKATKALKGPDAKPEAVVQRRLAEAKKLNARKRKRQRDKFAFAFEQAGVEKNDGNEVDNAG